MSERSTATDRGTGLLEMALVVAVLISLLCGVIDFGFGWRANITVASATRAGARTGSNSGDDRLADYNILQALKGGLASFPSDDILSIVVYESLTQDGRVPAACTGGSSQSGSCNVYDGSDLNRPQSDFSGATCVNAPDEAWCPLDREVQQSEGPDYVGVWVKVRHAYITGLFGSSVTITDSAVMRAEPQL